MAPLNGHGFVIMVCSELGLHRELANSVLSQFGVILGPWRAQTWPLDSNRLLTSFYTRILTWPLDSNRLLTSFYTRILTWPLDSNRLLTSFYTRILPSTPTLPPYYYRL